jgi:hypothetical protein
MMACGETELVLPQGIPVRMWGFPTTMGEGILYG